MRSMRTGFHRIGVVLAAISILFGIAAYSDRGTLRDVAVGAGFAAFLYALMVAVGWIVAGFKGDGDINSS